MERGRLVSARKQGTTMHRTTPPAADGSPSFPSSRQFEYVEVVEPAERSEQLIAFLSPRLPAPVKQEEDSNGILVFTGGSPGEVIARLTATSVIVEEFAIRWETPYAP